MSNLSDFQQVQQQFAAYIRDPDNQPMPKDVTAQRMTAYRQLFYNNVAGILANAYPVLRKIYDDNNWHRLIQTYFKNHHARTPLFPQIPQEFLRYLEQDYQLTNDDPAFLYELAHYEWVETAVNIDQREIDLTNINSKGDLLTQRPEINPIMWQMAYQFPVHKISPDFQPTTPPETPTYIAVFRNLQDNVNFVQLNPLSAHLLQKLTVNEQHIGQAVLENIATEMQHISSQKIIEAGLHMMQTWLEHDILLGVYKNN